jgi:phage host-nuclease inhibitor protein Gam
MATTTPKRLIKKISPAGADYTRADAEALATRLVELQLERETLVAERDAAALEVTRPYAPKIDTIDGELKSGLDILETWADHHTEEFGKAQSLTLSGHRVGWRLGQYAAKTLPKWTWDKVLAKLKEMPKSWRDRYIRVREEANKEALIADRLIADELAMVGVKIVQERRFYLEPAREGQADTTLTTPKP